MLHRLDGDKAKVRLARHFSLPRAGPEYFPRLPSLGYNRNFGYDIIGYVGSYV